MTQRALVQSTIQTVALTGQTEFTVPFEYLTRRYVVVTLLGPARKVLTLGTDYRFVSPTVISLLQSPGAEYTYLELRRITSATERLVNFMDGSILRAYDLSLSNIQTLHVAQEARDSVSVDGIGIAVDGNLDARGRKIINLAYAENPTDAVPLGQIQAMDNNAFVAAQRAEAAAVNAEQSYQNTVAELVPVKADVEQLKRKTAATSNILFSNSHKYKILHKIRHQFDGYASIIASGGYSYLYATGHSFDYTANELWVSYQANGGDAASYWVVYDLNNMTQKTWFKAGRRWTKTFFLHYTGGKRWLFARSADGSTKLVKFDVTALPTTGTTVLEEAGPRSDLSPLFASKLGNLMLVSYRGPTTNTTTYFNTAVLVDVDTWETKQSYRLGTVAAGDSEGTVAYCYKTQGMCLVPTGVALAHGGIVDFNRSYADGDFRVFQGAVIRSPEGAPLASGLFDPHKAQPILQAAGITVNRVEAEGINFAPETGALTMLFHTDGNADGEYLIVEAFSDEPDAIDLSGAAVSLATNVPDVMSLFRNNYGSLVDPVLGTVMTDVADVCKMMNRWDMRETSWYSTNFSGMQFNGAALPGSMRCKLFRGTPTTSYFEYMSSGAFKQFAIQLNSAGDVTSITEIRNIP